MTKEEALAILLASPVFDHVGEDGRHYQNKLGKFYKEYDYAYSWACFPYVDDDPRPDYAFEIMVLKDYKPDTDYSPVIPGSVPIYPTEEARELWIEDSPTHLLSIDEAKARGSHPYYGTMI